MARSRKYLLGHMMENRLSLFTKRAPITIKPKVAIVEEKYNFESFFICVKLILNVFDLISSRVLKLDE